MLYVCFSITCCGSETLSSVVSHIGHGEGACFGWLMTRTSMKLRETWGCHGMKKKGNKKMHTPRQKVIHNPHPYIFVMLKKCLSWFPLVPLIFHFGAKPHQKRDVLCWFFHFPRRTRMHTRITPPRFTCVQMESFSAARVEAHDLPQRCTIGVKQ